MVDEETETVDTTSAPSACKILTVQASTRYVQIFRILPILAAVGNFHLLSPIPAPELYI